MLEWTRRLRGPPERRLTKPLPLDMDTYVPHGRGVLSPDLLRLIHKTSIGGESLRSIGGYRIYAVDGALVRNQVHIDFTTGGNPGRYSYVPEGEVWVERVLEPADMAASLLHELVETHLMQVYRQDYDTAHEEASRVETLLRKSMVTTTGRVYRRRCLLVVSDWYAGWRNSL